MQGSITPAPCKVRKKGTTLNAPPVVIDGVWRMMFGVCASDRDNAVVVSPELPRSRSMLPLLVTIA